MTLDEAIEYYKQLSTEEADKTLNCENELAYEYWQLADWLTDLRMHRESEPRKSTVVAQFTITDEQVQQVKQELEDEFLESAKAMNAENAKLRELVLDLYEAYEGEVNDCWLVEFRERMRELGVEVDE